MLPTDVWSNNEFQMVKEEHQEAGREEVKEVEEEKTGGAECKRYVKHPGIVWEREVLVSVVELKGELKL